MLKSTHINTVSAVVLTSAAKLAGLYIVAQGHRAKFQKIGTVANLFMYPVKSCGVLETKQAKITNVGLEWDGVIDRQWMILDERNETITMKEEPRLSCIRCTTDTNKLHLHAPDMPVLSLPMRPDLSGGKPFTLKLLNQLISVAECGDDAKKWISGFLGRAAYMVFSCPDLGTRDAYLRQRKWSNEAKSGDVSIFAYLTSYLVTSTASLKHINSQLDPPVSMVNFRPNLVIDNTEPFDEDNWKEILIGDQILFHTVEPCRRCVITTIEPDTANKRADVQPLKLLRSFRCRAPYGGSPLFGVYFANDFPGFIKVGDPVYVLKA
ncbi:hypothetical protein RRG08_033893 [Elysia crispata]|uniref:MOSC domain-containing protein n=1 Tax=Elysia crispata TaxID=231223 RepID=A0AAE1ECA2_9GAST|nr:hypothetical protein RRG08_033893 [Elysia crispata]